LDYRICLVSTREFIDLLLRHVLGDSVALLNLSDQLVALAVDRGQIVLGEFDPLLFHLPHRLLPFAFDLIPVHFEPPELNIQLLIHSGDNVSRSEYSAIPSCTGHFA
jgi:hypothetical protein